MDAIRDWLIRHRETSLVGGLLMAALSALPIQLSSKQTQVTWLTVVELAMALCSVYLLYAPLGYVSEDDTTLDRMTLLAARHRFAAYGIAAVMLLLVATLTWSGLIDPSPLWIDIVIRLLIWSSVALLLAPTMYAQRNRE
ncbi:hypothetical protein [Bifidobacterium samirii]|uniref:Uncharacterized protein n=1 Tax=Bifidobacterium samirii TaxID=2306974 RepID=A0A430FNS8_9BIFI|nr:hypothetical protein [Bifidobacterium samirii]RSX54476.1 hypothetical protein D2E24_1597 [Bifidobacterium samirii]